MYWFKFRRTSAWAGRLKVFFYDRPIDPLYADVPGCDSAINSFTKPQLVALVEAGKAALAAWPED